MEESPQARAAWNEYEAKRLLASFGVPVCRERWAADGAEALAAARQLGYPVALKAAGSRISHKTEIGALALNVKTDEEVLGVSGRLLAIEGCEGLIVSEMVAGERELACGLVRHPLFGPCVMFGLGGVLAELLGEVVFRIAPLTERDALEMMDAVRGGAILGPWRGQAKADRRTLASILVALGEIGQRRPEITSVDINPLKIRPDGTPVAVDALVAEGGAEETAEERPTLSRRELEPFFSPRSVAVIGASAVPGKPGCEVIRNILANGFAGRIYPVNPKGGRILDLEVLPAAERLPAGVDVAVILLPAAATPGALKACAARGIRHFVLGSGGFAEVDEAGGRIQEELEGIIAREGLYVLGPNTSGHTSTPAGFTTTFFPQGRIRRGAVSYIAQTGNFGTHTLRYILTGEHFGVARVVGLGNKIGVDETDALAYLGQDPETKAVLMYLESIARPRRFLEVARVVAAEKPVALLKAGSTEEGRQAALAHTAAMATPDGLVEGLLAQAGVVRIHEYTHLILAGKAFSMLPLPAGRGVSFLAPSGAMLAVLSDLCARRGLAIPPLAEGTIRGLQEMSPPYIRMRNPVDIWPAALAVGVQEAYRRGMETVLRDPAVDAVVAVLMLTEETGVPDPAFIVDLARRFPRKPILVTFSGDKGCMDRYKEALEPQGIPTFMEIEEPFEVLSIMVRCRQARERAAGGKGG